MADPIEPRVVVLEREMREVQDKQAASDVRLQDAEAELDSIPDLIRLEFRRLDSHDAQRRAEAAELREHVSRVEAGIKAHVDARFEATVRAIAELLSEPDRKS